MLCVRIWYKYVAYWMFWTYTLRILRLKKSDSKNHDVINGDDTLLPMTCRRLKHAVKVFFRYVLQALLPRSRINYGIFNCLFTGCNSEKSGMDHTWDCKHLVAILGKLVVDYNNFDSGCWVYYHNAASICQHSSRKFLGQTSLSP